MKTPEQIQNDLQAMMAAARQTHTYKLEGAILEYTEEMVGLMEQQKVTNTELAKRIEVSPAYITKILRGTSNFTLDTMVKIATALDAEFRCHLQPRGIQSVWVDYSVMNSSRQSVSVPTAADPCEIVFTPTKLPKHIAASHESIPSAA